MSQSRARSRAAVVLATTTVALAASVTAGLAAWCLVRALTVWPPAVASVYRRLYGGGTTATPAAGHQVATLQPGAIGRVPAVDGEPHRAALTARPS